MFGVNKLLHSFREFKICKGLDRENECLENLTRRMCNKIFFEKALKYLKHLPAANIRSMNASEE